MTFYVIFELMTLFSQCVGYSNQMASTSGVGAKPIVFKFQSVWSKLRFYDDYIEIRDTDLGHTQT
jgi:hypothetical protein